MTNFNDTNEEHHVAQLLDVAYRPVGLSDTARERLRQALHTKAKRSLWKRLGSTVLCAAAVILAVWIATAGSSPSTIDTGNTTAWATDPGPAPFAGRPDDPEDPVDPDPSIPVQAPRHVNRPQLEVLAHGQTIQSPARSRVLRLSDKDLLFIQQQSQVSRSKDLLTLERGRMYVELGDAGAAWTVQAADKQFVLQSGRHEIAIDTNGYVAATSFAGTAQCGQLRLRPGQQLLPGQADPQQAVMLESRQLAWTEDLLASVHGRLVPSLSKQGCRLRVTGPNGQEDLELRRQHIDVHIEDGFARTTVDLTFFNHLSWRQEGTFVFPLPADASIGRLAMYVDGKLREAVMLERDRARNTYETIVHREKDPALLEWMDGSRFKLRVFPIEARQEKRLLISYTQRLRQDFGRLTWRFPGHRGLGSVKHWSCALHIQDYEQFQWQSPSHTFRDTSAGNEMFLHCEQHDVTPDADVIVHLDRYAGRVLDATLAVHRSEMADYYVLQYPVHDVPVQEAGPRDWLVLFETSADRNPVLAGAQLEYLRHFAKRLPEGDRLRVVTAALDGTLLPADGLEALRGSPLLGALDLGKSLQSLSRHIDAQHGRPHILHLGGANPSYGERRVDQLLQHLPADVVYVGVGVGKHINEVFMKAAAKRSGGWFTTVHPNDNLVWQAYDLHDRLVAGRMNQMVFAAAAGEEPLDFFYADDSASVGSMLTAVARVPRGQRIPTRLQLRYHSSGQELVQDVPVRSRLVESYPRRYWARLQLNHLLATGAKRKTVTALGLEHHVLTPFTSLMVFESDAQEREFKVVRRPVVYWAPYQSPAELPVRIEGPVIAGVDPSLVRRPSQHAVKATVLGRFHIQDVVMDDFVCDMWHAQDPFDDPEPGPTPGGNLNQLTDQLATLGAAMPSQSPMLFAKTLSRAPLMDADWKYRDENQSRIYDNLLTIGQWSSALSRRSFDAMLGRIPESSQQFLTKLHKLAPGLQNHAPDLADVYDVEARPAVRFFPGQVTDAAEELIQRARQSRWFHVQLPADENGPAWSVLINTDGRLSGERILHSGLQEQLRCDGKTIWHLYPELGLGSKRRFGRHALQQWQAHLPFMLESVEDLRRGYHIDSPDGNSLTLTPIASGEQAMPVQRIHFDESGRVVEREILAAEGKPHRRSVIQFTAEQILVELTKEEGTEQRAYQLSQAMPNAILTSPKAQALAVQPVTEHSYKIGDTLKSLAKRYYDNEALWTRLQAANPSFSVKKTKPATIVVIPPLQDQRQGMLILPMPARPEHHLRHAMQYDDLQYSETYWSDLTARAMASQYLQQSRWNMRRLVANRITRGDRRLGWYVLMLSAESSIDVNGHYHVGQFRCRLQPVQDHPHAAVAAYIENAWLRRRWHRARRRAEGPTPDHEMPVALKTMAAGLWQSLDSLDTLVVGGQSHNWLPPELMPQLSKQVIASGADKKLLTLLLSMRLQAKEATYQDIESLLELAKQRHPQDETLLALRSALRYAAGHYAESWNGFKNLYRSKRSASAQPVMPLLFVDAARAAKAEAELLNALRNAVDDFLESGEVAEVMKLCWYARVSGLHEFAEQSATRGLAAIKKADDLVALVRWLWFTDRRSQAVQCLQELLPDIAVEHQQGLQLLLATMLQQTGKAEQALRLRESALSAMIAHQDVKHDLQSWQRLCRRLLADYQGLALAQKRLGQQVDPRLTRAVQAAADQWLGRSHSPVEVYKQAALTLSALQEDDLAWSYRSSILALQPGSSAVWSQLAKDLARQGDVVGADKAWSVAADIEPTNAELFWQHAQMLQQHGRHHQARVILQHIADTDWQERFERYKMRARRQLLGQQ